MSIELATAYVSIVPSAKGIAASIGKELAPISGIASTQGAVAGKALGGSLTGALGQVAPAANSLLRRITTGISSPAGIAALGAAAFVGLVSVGKQFGAVNRIIRQETGATGKTLEGLGDTVKRVFATSPESLKEITTAVDELFKRGVPLGAQLDKLAEQELFLSKITGSDLATTVEQTTAVFAKFNVPVRDQSRELDVLFKAQQQSGKGFDELVSSLQRAGAPLQQFGFGLDESTALIVSLQKAGVNVQPALAGLRLAFGKITQAGGKPKEVLHDLIAELTSGKNPTEAMSKALKLFGARSGAELAIAIQKGKFSIADMLKTITDGRGGIIETGKATLTLAEQFTIFKHRALLDLSEFGAKALTIFKTVVNEGGPVLGDLVGSVTRLFKELAPALAPIGLLLVATFKVAIPTISAFATGLDTITSALGHVPGPVIAAASALGLLVIGFAALKLALVTGAISSFLADLNPVTATLVVTAAAITALGAVMSIFGHHSDEAKKEAKALGQSLFDASNEAGIFASGIDNATQGLERYFAQQIRSGKDDSLATTLAHSSTSVAALAESLSRGDAAWKKFTDSVVSKSSDVVKATKAIAETSTGPGTDILKSIGARTQLVEASKEVIDSLNKERDAFVLDAQKQLFARQATGELTAAQVKLIEKQTANRDGSINYARALDGVNRALADQALKQDQVASKNVETSRTFGQLANAVSTGTISTADATEALKKLGFSSDAVKTKLKDLTTQSQSFATAVSNALPSVDAEVKNFTQQITTDTGAVKSSFEDRASIIKRFADSGAKSSQDLTNALAQNSRRQANASTTAQIKSAFEARAEILQRFADAGKGSSKELNDALAENTKQIVDNLHTLAEDQDPAKFTENLRVQAAKAAKFLGNLRILVREGFGNLAGILAKQGPEAAGALASGLASNKSKAVVAASAADLLTNTDAVITRFAQGHFSELNGIGAGMAKAVTARFKPDFTPGISPALAAAERALAADGRISQAAGEVGVAAVENFGGNLTLSQAVSVALTAAHSVLTDDTTVPAAAVAAAKRVSDRFTPSFSGRISAQVNAAADALRRDPTITQAAGDKGLAVLRVWGANLTLGQAVRLALRAAHDALTGNGTVPAAAGALGERTSEKFKPDLAPPATKAARDAIAALAIQEGPTADATRRLAAFGAAAFNPDLATPMKTAAKTAATALSGDTGISRAARIKATEVTGRFGEHLTPADKVGAAFGTAATNISAQIVLISNAAILGIETGQGFVTGLVNELSNTNEALRVSNAASGLAGNIETGAKKRLGIKSPSTVGADLARQFVAGIASFDPKPLDATGAKIALALTDGFKSKLESARLQDVFAGSQVVAPVKSAPVAPQSIRQAVQHAVAVDIAHRAPVAVGGGLSADAFREALKDLGGGVAVKQEISMRHDVLSVADLEQAGRAVAWRVANTGRRP